MCKCFPTSLYSDCLELTPAPYPKVFVFLLGYKTKKSRKLLDQRDFDICLEKNTILKIKFKESVAYNNNSSIIRVNELSVAE